MVDVANSEFFAANVSTVTTDFSVSPYYDDFDGRKNYYKVLFKPGFAVQARELTQLQSMLQDQISRFGQHIFKEGSKVLGGKFYVDVKAPYVKVNDKDTDNLDVDITRFKNQIVTGQVTGIQAYINLVEDGAEGTDEPKTLYVSYLSGNPDTDEITFAANEPLVANVGTLVVSNTNPVGYGSVFTINEGIRYAKEHFIYNSKQSVVIDRYGTQPTCQVGFYLQESIVDSNEDSSLLDPALESSNYFAPGADRFKIVPILTRIDIDDVAGPPDYVNLFIIENGIVTEVNERPIYNIIRDELAKRTLDESGDYYVRGFNTIIEEHLDNGENDGYLTLDRGGNSQLLSIQVEGGTAYVKGYEVNKLVTSFLETEKSTSFSNVNGQIISSSLGNYVVANEVVGAWNVNTGQTIDLYDTAQQRVTRGVGSIPSQTGSKIGTARVKSISKDTGTFGTANGNMRIHLFDIQMLGSNSFANVKSVYYNNSSTADLGADIVLSANTARIWDQFSSLLYYTGSNYTKTLRSPDGTVDTSFLFKKTSEISIATGGTFSLTSSVGNEIFPYGTSTLSTADKGDIFLNLNSNVSINISGSALAGSGSNTLTGNASCQFTRLNVGDKIALSGNSSLYVISAIANDRILTVTTNLPSISSNTLQKVYVAGDMIDLTTKGVDAGETRTVSATSSSLTFDLKETFGTTVSGTVSYTMARTNAREIRKVLRRNRYVIIDCSQPFAANTTGPYSLGFSDVYRINSIRKASSFTTVNDGVDVTNEFVFDNGQRDDSYQTAQIIPYNTLTSSDKLLVSLDYFRPDYTLGVGYFSIDSYPVNDISPTDSQLTTEQLPIYISPTTGAGYELKNFLDFRPVYTNTATDATVLGLASVNPASSTTLQYDSSGLRLPADSEQITYDYSYYLARRDLITLNNNGNFMIIRGVPSVNPVTPACPPHLMSIAKLFITPYPSLSPSYAAKTGLAQLACSTSRTAQVRFTMKDIGVLKQRIDNLENYVSLSLLEKSALDLKILDENGLDRFKNGIFVDSFTSFSLSDVGNPDHRICYDPKEGSIRPLFESQSIGYDYFSGTDVVLRDNMLMLPYTEVVALRQPYATTFRNVETTVYRFIGKMYLDPPSDYWVNDRRLASQTFRFGATDADVTPYSVVYGSWQTTVTGVTTTDPVLISSDTTTTGTSGPGTTTTSTQTITFSPGGGGAVELNSLISTYGASTPVSLSSGPIYNVRGSRTARAMNVPDSLYSSIKTLGDVAANLTTLLEQLRLFAISFQITSTTGGAATTTTTNTFSTTTTTASQSSRQFTETFQTLKTQTRSIGDKVVSVAPIADIRPQTIAFEARGLKASTRHYMFFDGQLMSDFVTPGIVQNTANTLYANTTSSRILTRVVEGSPLYSNEGGYVYGFLRIPSNSTKSFRTGTKECVITDSPTNDPEATSFAKAYFSAQGITQTVQETIISTGTIVSQTKNGVERGDVTFTTNTTNTIVTTSTTTGNANTITVTGNIVDLPSCMAYSFKMNTPEGVEGSFLSSVDVFFAGKDPNLGVWFEVRAMDNAGNITKVQVPGSEVWLQPEQVNLPVNDLPVATKVTFNARIFLQNNQEYAFIIHTVGINPNYYMYVSVLGQEDIETKRPVNSRALTGTLFTTNNNTDWDIVPRTDLKCVFYRASFNTSVIGEAILGNQSREYIQLPLSPATGANTSWFGDRIAGNDLLNLSTPSGGTIGVTDVLTGSNSNVIASVVSVDGSLYSTNNTGFIVNEPITVKRSNGLVTAITTSVISKNTAYGEIYKAVPKNDPYTFNGNTIVLVVSDSNGQFKANDVLHFEFSGNTVNTTNITKQIYSTVQFEPSYINFTTTTCDFAMSTTSNSNPTIEDSYVTITPSVVVDFDDEKALYSRTTEVSQLSGLSSNRVRVQMSTFSDYITPIVNLERTYTVYINHLINSNTSFELQPFGGLIKNKYISQVITLADGQDAEDLRIILSAYRPPKANAQIKVYVRVTHSEDFESIYTKDWIEMVPFNENAYSSLANRRDWREFQYKFPDSVMTGENDQSIGILQYTNRANTVFTGFKQYQIKIGLVSESSAIYPRVADLRAIALQL